jgi:hypothetical protein
MQQVLQLRGWLLGGLSGSSAGKSASKESNKLLVAILQSIYFQQKRG